jgi:hypothetical protein
MKKLFFATLLAVTVAGSAFATEVNKVSSAVMSSFKNEFKQASDISWKTGEGFAKATFTLNNQQMEAFYNYNGQLIASDQYITFDQLAAEAQKSFSKKFGGYEVKQVIHFEGTEEEAYYVSAENEVETVVVKIDTRHELSIFKRTKK